MLKLFQINKTYITVFFLIYLLLFRPNSSFSNELSFFEEKNQAYNLRNIVEAGHAFFGKTSGGLARIVAHMFSTYGTPNGYIVGEEGAGSFFFGLTYGEGKVYCHDSAGIEHTNYIFWQGPSLGWDFGIQGSRIMILIYNLKNIQELLGRFSGISGAAYLVSGLGVNVMKKDTVLLIPIRTGLGARLGINIGYLKFTESPTWNPL